MSTNPDHFYTFHNATGSRSVAAKPEVENGDVLDMAVLPPSDSGRSSVREILLSSQQTPGRHPAQKNRGRSAREIYSVEKSLTLHHPSLLGGASNPACPAGDVALGLLLARPALTLTSGLRKRDQGGLGPVHDNPRHQNLCHSARESIRGQPFKLAPRPVTSREQLPPNDFIYGPSLSTSMVVDNSSIENEAHQRFVFQRQQARCYIQISAGSEVKSNPNHIKSYDGDSTPANAGPFQLKPRWSSDHGLRIANLRARHLHDQTLDSETSRSPPNSVTTRRAKQFGSRPGLLGGLPALSSTKLDNTVTHNGTEEIKQTAQSISSDMESLVKTLTNRAKVLDRKYKLGDKASPTTLSLPRARAGYGSYAKRRNELNNAHPQDRLQLLSQAKKSDGQIRMEQSMRGLRRDIEASTRQIAQHHQVSKEDIEDSSGTATSDKQAETARCTAEAMQYLHGAFSKTLEQNIADAQRAGVVRLLDDSEATVFDTTEVQGDEQMHMLQDPTSQFTGTQASREDGLEAPEDRQLIRDEEPSEYTDNTYDVEESHVQSINDADLQSDSEIEDSVAAETESGSDDEDLTDLGTHSRAQSSEPLPSAHEHFQYSQSSVPCGMNPLNSQSAQRLTNRTEQELAYSARVELVRQDQHRNDWRLHPVASTVMNQSPLQPAIQILSEMVLVIFPLSVVHHSVTSHCW